MINYKNEMIDTTFFNQRGWVHLKDILKDDTISNLRTRMIRLAEWVSDKQGQPCEYGPPFHWKGLGCAGMYDDYLMNFYTDKGMYEIVSSLLQSKDVWLYNDQVVVKFPNDSFEFDAHTDNTAGNNTNEGKNTVNLCVILDDFTDENGTLEMFNKDDGQRVKIYPKAGDIVAIHGDTLHQSGPNKSDTARCLYACVYSSEQLIFQNFYTTKMEHSGD